MKKSLLFCLSAVLTASSAVAATPQEFSNTFFSRVSPDGRYIVSAIYGTMIVRDVQNGTDQVFEGEDGGAYYDMGLGNCVSNNGIIVGSTTDQFDAAYLENGQWHSLATPKPDNINLVHGVTPDGNRICGNVGMMGMSLEHTSIMQLPVYWDRNADGTYTSYNFLPHPETDLLGRVPQYITAIGISDDGKTIVGQVVDNSGMIIQPIVYRQDAEGNWTYELVINDLFNPEHLELPEHPGEYPESPDIKDYMTPEKLAEYEAAYQAWVDSFYQGEYPEPANYLDAAGAEEYNKAVDAYNAIAKEYNEKLDKYLTVFDQIRLSSPALIYNTALISPEGQYYAFSNAVEVDTGGWAPEEQLTIWRLNLNDKSLSKYDNAPNVAPTCMAADGVMLGCTPTNTENTTAYILDVTTNEFVKLHDFFQKVAPDYATWMTEHMTFPIESYDWDTEEFKTDNYLITGCPYASYDLKTITSWVANVWDFTTVANSYYFDMTGLLGGVNDVTTDAIEAKALKAYNLQGIEVSRDTKGLIILSNGTKVYNK